MSTRIPFQTLRFLLFAGIIGGVLGGLPRLVWAEAAAQPGAEPEVSRRWLGPLGNGGRHLPPVPTPLADADQVWTIERALKRVLQANPDVQVALAGVERQDGARLQSVALLLPRIGITASADRRDEGLIDRSASELAFPPSLRTAVAESAHDIRLELRQTVFDGLASWHQVRRMALLKKKAAIDAREIYLRVASQVRQAYDTTLLRQKVVGTRKDAVRDLKRFADVAQKRFVAGEVAEFESLRAQSAVRAAEAELAQAEADVARADEAICRILYVDKPAGGLRLAGNLMPLDYRESFETALVRAQAGRLDLRSAELQLDAAVSAQRAAGAGYMPRIEAFAGYGYRSSYYDAHRQIEGWTFGLMGRWDLFEGGQTVGAVRAQRAERRMAEIRLAETRRLIGSQIRELFASLDQSKTLMLAHASARELGERSVREAQRLFEVGRVSLEQVLNAELAYRQALLGWLSAIFTYNATVYQLDYATANESFLDAAAPPGQ